jgi:hypothetical protein
MAKDTQIQLRVSLQKKTAWKEVAAETGQSLSAWLERLADEEVANVNAAEGDREAARAERRFLLKSTFPTGEKKSYQPDFK